MLAWLLFHTTWTSISKKTLYFLIFQEGGGGGGGGGWHPNSKTYISTLKILMDFFIHIDTISMGLPTVYLQGLQIEYSK